MKSALFAAPLWVLALLAAPLATAQDNARVVKFRVICPEHQDGLTKAQVGEGSASIEVPLLSGNFSDEFELSFAAETASFFTEDASAPEGRRLIAQGKLATGTQQVFLFLPDPQPQMPYRIYAMNDDEKTFPMGSVRILNLCPAPVRFTIAGAEMKPLEPGRHVIYPPVKTADEWNMYQVLIHYQVPDGNWIQVSTPSWKSSELKRDFVITSLDVRTKQPRIYNFKDIPPWRKPDMSRQP